MKTSNPSTLCPVHVPGQGLDLPQIVQQLRVLEPKQQGQFHGFLQESYDSGKILQLTEVSFDVRLVAMSQPAAVTVQGFPDGLRRGVSEVPGVIKLPFEKPS